MPFNASAREETAKRYKHLTIARRNRAWPELPQILLQSQARRGALCTNKFYDQLLNVEQSELLFVLSLGLVRKLLDAIEGHLFGLDQ